MVGSFRNFTAIDFETAHANYPCEIGLSRIENGIIIDASTKFQEITGIMINPLARKTLFEIFDSSERTEYLKQIQGNNTNSFTVKIKNRNGDTIISFEAINIMCEYRDRMIKLLAMRNPEY